MVAAKADVPYHMQEDSDDEELPEDTKLETDQAESSKAVVVAIAEEKEKRLRARIGKVELDPMIRMSTTYTPLSKLMDAVRLCGLYEEWTWFGVPSLTR